MSCMLLEAPQKQVGHLPEGQFPPQESARARAINRRATNTFMEIYYYGQQADMMHRKITKICKGNSDEDQHPQAVWVLHGLHELPAFP